MNGPCRIEPPGRPHHAPSRITTPHLSPRILLACHQREYKSCFWDERHDAQRNRERVKALDRKFREKYPQIPGDIPAPLCGW